MSLSRTLFLFNFAQVQKTRIIIKNQLLHICGLSYLGYNTCFDINFFVRFVSTNRETGKNTLTLCAYVVAQNRKTISLPIIHLQPALLIKQVWEAISSC